jgi:hypothetical protein
MRSKIPLPRLGGGVAVIRDGGVMGNSIEAHDPSARAKRAGTSPETGERKEEERMYA